MVERIYSFCLFDLGSMATSPQVVKLGLAYWPRKRAFPEEEERTYKCPPGVLKTRSFMVRFCFFLSFSHFASFFFSFNMSLTRIMLHVLYCQLYSNSAWHLSYCLRQGWPTFQFYGSWIFNNRRENFSKCMLSSHREQAKISSSTQSLKVQDPSSWKIGHP